MSEARRSRAARSFSNGLARAATSAAFARRRPRAASFRARNPSFQGFAAGFPGSAILSPPTGLARPGPRRRSGPVARISGRGIHLFKGLRRNFRAAPCPRQRGSPAPGPWRRSPVGDRGRRISGRGIHLFKDLRLNIRATRCPDGARPRQDLGGVRPSATTAANSGRGIHLFKGLRRNFRACGDPPSRAAIGAWDLGVNAVIARSSEGDVVLGNSGGVLAGAARRGARGAAPAILGVPVRCGTASVRDHRRRPTDELQDELAWTRFPGRIDFDESEILS